MQNQQSNPIGIRMAKILGTSRMNKIMHKKTKSQTLDT